mmetsp:Transcript_34737/g.63142  ORF Transcript_34737/g.63142 Transcript_34737/m.63142 type:complete len:249 (-) Transcript_34737:121-867(-)
MGGMAEDARTVGAPVAARKVDISAVDGLDTSPYTAEIKYDRLPCVALSTCLEEEEPEDADEADDICGHHAADRVGAIITNATDELIEVNGLVAATPSGSRGAQARAGLMGTGAERAPQRGSEIAKLLAQPRRTTELRSYLESQQFWKVPHFLRDLEADFQDEEEYIMSVQEEREAPTKLVRLLETGEKEFLVQGLKQQFQRATASFLKADPKSRSKKELEEELERIKQDIENISRPYIFVEAEPPGGR